MTPCVILCLLVVCSCMTVHARVLLQTQNFDLLLAVQPEGHLAYGGRHITMAAVSASSRDAAAAAVKQCNSYLMESKTRALGWAMKGPPANCLGHMDAGASSCKDNKPWDLTKDGYSYTPTIAIASQTLDAYADCLSTKSAGGVTIKLKGPKYAGTVWHSALYGSSKADAQAEFDRFVSNHAAWTPYLNSRHISDPSCPATLNPKGEPGPVGNRCWHWTAVA